MALKLYAIQLDELTADPGSPVEGQVWYRTDLSQFRIYRNGATDVVIDKVTFDAHALASTNPHGTTLEQARTAGATLAGDVDLGGNDLVNVGGTGGSEFNAANQAYVVDQINQRLQGLDWQESVLDKDLTAPPGSPAPGDRYIVAVGGTGAWLGRDNQIAEWDGAAWGFTVPDVGFATVVEDEGLAYLYSGTSWGAFGTAVRHSDLVGLGNDDHAQYLLVSGARAMAGDLDVGANDVTNVGLVDGVDVSDHSARHDPGGVDALTTAAPGATGVGTTPAEGVAASFARSDHVHQANTAPANVTKAAAAIGVSGEPARADHKHDVSTAAPVSVGTANAEGAATSLARSDHVHEHGAQSTEGHHALTASTRHGFQPRSNRNATVDPTANNDSTEGYAVGSYWVNVTTDVVFFAADVSIGSAVWQPAAGGVQALVHKAGRVAVGSFAGNPKKATVTFAAAFADADYGVTVTAVTQNNKQFAPVIESQVAGAFTINLGSNNSNDLLYMNWVAIKSGESS